MLLKIKKFLIVLFTLIVVLIGFFFFLSKSQKPMDISNKKSLEKKYTITTSGNDTLVYENNTKIATIPNLISKLENNIFIYRVTDSFIYIGEKITPKNIQGYDSGMRSLYRVDRSNFTVQSLNERDWSIADISQDENMIAYLIFEPNYWIILKDLNNESLRMFPVANKSTDYFMKHTSSWKFGDVLFSPDGKTIAYGVLVFESAANNDEIIFGTNGMIRTIDATENKYDPWNYKNIAGGKGGIYRITEWKDDKTITHEFLQIEIPKSDYETSTKNIEFTKPF